MTYQTQIPDDFRPPQFIDEKFQRAHEAYTKAGHRPGAPWVLALPRPELDPSSRVHFSVGTQSDYEIGTKTDRVAMMHVIAAGRGRVRLGFREQVPVQSGDMVLVNLREAGHWASIAGLTLYGFTSDVAMARVYRTVKTLTPPAAIEDRAAWHDDLYWNIRDVLNDFVVLGRDPNAERLYRLGDTPRRIELTDASYADGTRSDDTRSKTGHLTNRFPMVYRRVLGAGPGRCYRKEDELGFPDYVVNRSEAEPGDMLAYCKTVRAAEFMFQGMPLEIIRSASIFDYQEGRQPRLNVQESCGSPIPYDEPSEDEAEPDELGGR
jgi:hypothetical protein